MLQEKAFEILKKGKNVFLTGCAGSGKTHVLNRYVSFLKEKGVSVGVTASTGIAATHLNGITIHSWTGMGILDDLDKEDLRKVLKKRYLSKRLKKTEVLIIDEISMLSDSCLDVADYIIRSFRKNEKPFGGMQVVLCGDFFQLPPIVKNNGLQLKNSGFAYKSRAWKELNLDVCYLTEQYRHEGKGLLSILNAIRENSVDDNALNLLHNQCGVQLKSNTEITKLYTHNINVDYINERELENLDGKTKTFHMKRKGPEKLAEILSKNLLAPKELKLKKDAVVMFVKNNFEKGYVNGTLGRIVSFENGEPVVKTTKGKHIKVLPEKWSIEEDGEIKAEVKQLPLRLAWAITVHKSQGMTLDFAEIDLRKSFEPGMGYVALSRARSLDGIRLIGINDTALKINKEIFEKDKEFQKVSIKLEN